MIKIIFLLFAIQNVDIAEFKHLEFQTETLSVFEIKFNLSQDCLDTVKKVLYKLGSEPVENYDTTGSMSFPVDTIMTSQESERILFIWFEDEKGNSDYRNNKSVLIPNPFRFHLFNEIGKKQFWGGGALELGMGEGYLLDIGFITPFAELAFQFETMGYNKDNKELWTNGYLIGFSGVDLILSKRIELVQNVIGLSPCIGGEYYIRNISSGKSDTLPSGKEILITEETREVGPILGISIVKYVIPAFTVFNVAGIGINYQHIFCEEDVNKLGTELTMILTNKKRENFLSTSFGVKIYYSKSLSIPIVYTNVKVYWGKQFIK